MIKNREEAIFTIPNIMSIIRIILIIPFIYIYFQERYVISTVLLLLSGLTDAIDGFIARKFNVNRQEFPHFRKSLDFQVVG